MPPAGKGKSKAHVMFEVFLCTRQKERHVGYDNVACSQERVSIIWLWVIFYFFILGIMRLSP